MRQGQQNRRGRGRNNNHSSNNNNNNNQHRKGGQNPLSRSYESTGPDTKIRGTPAHIAEKYMQLARDAQSSGDPVLAENYLQHAEHYNRIIMTYREQQMQNGGEGQPQNGQAGRFRSPGMGEDDYNDEDGGGDEFGNVPNGGAPSMRQGDPQPRFEGGGQRFDERPQRHDQQRPHHQNRDRDRGEQRNFNDRGDRQDRFERPDRDRGDRIERGDRPERQDRAERADRPERAERAERPERRDAPERAERPERAAAVPAADAPAAEATPRRRERAPMPAHEQPEFLRRPVRRPRRETTSDEGEDTPAPADASESD